ncbi:hypothetical protein INR49_032335 [Caranx melampygus]|nr:hypothetical protein INR49_032335 [Caranx melampygus]
MGYTLVRGCPLTPRLCAPGSAECVELSTVLKRVVARSSKKREKGSFSVLHGPDLTVLLFTGQWTETQRTENLHEHDHQQHRHELQSLHPSPISLAKIKVAADVPREKKNMVRPTWKGSQHRTNAKTITPGRGEETERQGGVE